MRLVLRDLSILVFLFLLVVIPCMDPWPASGSESPIGRLINPQGQVSVLPAGGTSWEQGSNSKDLFPGDTVKTAQDSRVSILCVDESQLKLNENTVLVLKSSVPSPRLGIATPAAHGEAQGSLYEVPKGEIWLRNKSEKVRFDVQTPAVTAAIRGTEFNLKVDDAGAAALVLLEGKIRLSNPQGAVDLNPGEEGMARVGQAPVKRVLLQPDDAVQWSLYYPGIFSFRDIPMGAGPDVESPAAPMIRLAQAAYDSGDLDGAQSIAEDILARNPENGPALTILGWTFLQRQDPEKALTYLQRATKQNTWRGLAISGLALAEYRLGNPAGAYELMVRELKESPPSPLLLVMSGYFSMLAGKIDEAKAFLTDRRIIGRESSMAHSLLSQILLVQNHKKEAAAEASLALDMDSQSPLAKMTNALIQIACFDLPQARRFLEDALAADPRFLQAYVYMARIWLGSDYLDRAKECITKALEISKTDGEVLSLAGFIHLGYRDFDRAFKLFSEAVKADPGFGDPHVGLSNIAFKNRNPGLGLTEMLTATLLEPRVSLYQSSLGKALYQTRAFEKALEVYDYAKTLDPNDPTPYLYKGIALSDLNRPGEAIQELNKSIQLNDNTAIFRSRLMLDRDLAIRNTDLARAYSQLGLTDWSFSKALTAVKNDPLSASAHLFLSSAFQSTRQRTGAAASELLLYRLLAPANQNTFSVYSDYTPMFEMPYVRTQVAVGAGTWNDHIGPIQDYNLEILGGLPGLALDAYGDYSSDPGMRRINSDTDSFFGLLEGKYEPTIKDSLLASYIYSEYLSGDTGSMNDYSYANDPNLRSVSRENSVEGGYVHRFAPEAVFLAYYNYGHEDWFKTDPLFGSFTAYNNQTDPNHLYPIYVNTLDPTYRHTYQDWHNIQLQQQLMLGSHTVITGMDYFSGYLDYSYMDTMFAKAYYTQYGTEVYLPPQTVSNEKYYTPDNTYSVYMRDYWHITSKLLAEYGISGDFVDNSRAGFSESIHSVTANPFLGFDYELDPKNTLRVAYQQYVNTHSMFNGGIAPTEVAGFPAQINADNGSKVQELGFSWETQWNPLTFTVFRLMGHHIDNPQFDPTDLTENRVISVQTDRLMGSFTVNRLLTSSLGLSATISGKMLSLDAPSDTSFVTGDYSEIDGTIGLSYQHPSGWFASISSTLVHQDLSGLSDQTIQQKQTGLSGNIFDLVNIGFGKQFDLKRGFFSLSINNIFNQHFYYETEPVQLNSFYPDRQIMFQIGLNF
jgi:tetratricopeptide (TPR) repeat protein